MELSRRLECGVTTLYHQDARVIWMEERLEGDMVTVKLGGSLVSEAEHPFMDEMTALLQAGKRLSFELEEAEHISAAFLHAFLSLQKRADQRGMPSLRFRKLSDAARKEFEDSGYSELFDIA